MFKKLLLSILCLSTLSSKAAPWINAKFLYPFIAAQSGLAAGYYFNDAYKTHKLYEFQKREDEISKWIDINEAVSFLDARMIHNIHIEWYRDQSGNRQPKCQALQNIRDRLESKVHEVQKSTNHKQIKLVITPDEDFASSQGYIIQIPLKEIAKLYQLSNDLNKKQAQGITTEDIKIKKIAYENHLQGVYASLGHELSHIENNDTENTIIATATIPCATEGIWQIGTKLLKRKPSPSHLSSFQFLYKTANQLPIGAAKFCLTGILLAYYAASQEYRCDKQSIEYMGRASTPALIKWFERGADKQKQNIENYFNNGFPLNDSAINFISTMESGHPSHKYRAERLKKLLEKEEQKQKL